MTQQKRDQRPYDRVQQYLPGPILNAMLETVGETGDPCQTKPGLGGMTAYPPRAMAAACILMGAEMKTYGKMVGHLGMHPDVVRRIGLPGVPSKSTVWRACGMIPEPYLREVRLRVVRDVVAGSLAGDGTGYSGNRFVRRFSVRHGRTQTGRGWIKLHGTIDMAARAIPDCHVTDGHAADIASLWPMMDRPGAPYKDGSFFCLDSAYLAQAAVRRDSQPGPDAPDPARIQHRLQERRQPGLGGHDPDARRRP